MKMSQKTPQKTPPKPAPCPCGSGAALASCCGRYIDALETAPSAEALMRSRYSAFVLGRADYLQATWHTSTRPASLTLDSGQRWLGLTVRGTCPTGPETAQVQFLARWREKNGRAVRLHEISRFVREGGRWYYVDGDMLN